MTIEESGIDYEVMFNLSFVRATHAEFDHIIWMVREAIKSLQVSFWDANEDVSRRNKIKEEGLDCWHVDFGDITRGPVRTIEVVPWPKGVLTIWVRNATETQPKPEDPETISFPSQCVQISPVLTTKQLRMQGGMTDIDTN
jgi:hypothetical protein